MVTVVTAIRWSSYQRTVIRMQWSQQRQHELYIARVLKPYIVLYTFLYMHVPLLLRLCLIHLEYYDN